MIPSYYQGLLSEEELGNTKMNALAQGLLGAGQAFVRAGAPSLMPTSSGFVDAVSQGMAGYQGAVQNALAERVNAAKVQDMLTKQKQAQELQGIFKTGDVKQIIPQLQQLGRFDLIKDLSEATISQRKAGFNRPEGAAEAPSPFAPFLESPSPAVRKLAGQLQQGFNSGVIDEETAYKRIEPLTRMEESFANRQEAAANRAVTAAQGKKPTEQERLASGFAQRMELSDQLIKDVENKVAQQQLAGKDVGSAYPTARTQALGNVPLVGDYLRNVGSSKQQQLYRQAQENWVRANLRKESGAAIGKDEMEAEIKTYFPQPGEDPTVRAQKEMARQVTQEAMRTAAGTAYKPFDMQQYKKSRGLE